MESYIHLSSGTCEYELRCGLRKYFFAICIDFAHGIRLNASKFGKYTVSIGIEHNYVCLSCTTQFIYLLTLAPEVIRLLCLQNRHQMIVDPLVCTAKPKHTYTLMLLYRSAMPSLVRCRNHANCTHIHTHKHRRI